LSGIAVGNAALVDGQVAVVVDPVTDLERAGMERGVVVVAVVLAARPAVAVDVDRVRVLAVAVLVDPVAADVERDMASSPDREDGSRRR
jgi:hypothetical protein